MKILENQDRQEKIKILSPKSPEKDVNPGKSGQKEEKKKEKNQKVPEINDSSKNDKIDKKALKFFSKKGYYKKKIGLLNNKNNRFISLHIRPNTIYLNQNVNVPNCKHNKNSFKQLHNWLNE